VNAFEIALQEESRKVPLELTAEIREKIILYDQLLIEWGKKFNLTGLKKEQDRILWLYMESLWAASMIDKVKHIVDIGSGCGFPGMALQWWHKCRLTMVESRSKKCIFLKEAIHQCKMDGCDVKNIRFEGDLAFLRREEKGEVLLCWRAVGLEEKAIRKLTESMKDRDELLCFFGKESKDYPILEKQPLLRIKKKKEFPLSHQRFILQMIKCST
jgi:16S rRNA (guanine(527)-N(7))-methyltransferase RsmG